MHPGDFIVPVFLQIINAFISQDIQRLPDVTLPADNPVEAGQVCLGSPPPICVCVSDLLQIASASSEPSAHSDSPSQRHLAGTHCPFLQAKSVVAHVFFAVETKASSINDFKRGKGGQLLYETVDTATGPFIQILFKF